MKLVDYHITARDWESMKNCISPILKHSRVGTDTIKRSAKSFNKIFKI